MPSFANDGKGEWLRIRLFHISEDYEKTIPLFKPDIPESVCLAEEVKTKRICTSSTLEGCMKGHPNLWYDVFEYPHKKYTYPEWVMNKMTVLLSHGEITGHLYKVYEFDVDEQAVVKPHELFQKKLVPDALDTQEHWILSDAVAVRRFYLFVKGAKLVNGEKVFKYQVFKEDEIGIVADGFYHLETVLNKIK